MGCEMGLDVGLGGFGNASRLATVCDQNESAVGERARLNSPLRGRFPRYNLVEETSVIFADGLRPLEN